SSACCCSTVMFAIPPLISPGSDQIEKGENEYPNQVDKVPVKPGRFDRFIRALAVVMAAQDAQQHDGQVDQADRHMQTVEAGQHKEGGAELRCACRVAVGTEPGTEQAAPFIDLHPQER